MGILIMKLMVRYLKITSSPTALSKAEFHTRKYFDYYKGNPHISFFFYLVKLAMRDHFHVHSSTV